MQEAFPELKLEKQEKQARQCDISHIKYALETTVIESEVNFEANCEIRRNTAEECIETINMLSQKIEEGDKTSWSIHRYKEDC